ncbi:hypothetical protein C6P45_001485 [Maudiozyma exigua]|uniref:Glutaredoxin domain-containing protein n=1 Tax=Maudiozyma exigua TaxID=34358 RepID=A0A9P6WDQ3_MAUEX|nr:hypothetical protein C6P45_001485 [Kazachstania exigua]
MIVSTNGNSKKAMFSQRSKHNRLVSATLVLLGIFTFLFLTWGDYSEDSSFGFLQEKTDGSDSITKTQTDSTINSNGLQYNTIDVSATSTNTGLLTEDKYNMNQNDNNKGSQEESKLNSKKVEEQISTIRGEISNERKTTILSPTVPTSLTPKVFNPEFNFKEILNTSPVVLFIRSSEVDSQYLKKLLLNEYEISPQISIVDLDQHSNGDKLQDSIQTKKISASATQKVPFLFINSIPVISTNIQKDIKNLHSDGSLLQKFRHLANGKVLFEKMGLPSNS